LFLNSLFEGPLCPGPEIAGPFPDFGGPFPPFGGPFGSGDPGQMALLAPPPLPGPEVQCRVKGGAGPASPSTSPPSGT